MDPFIGTNVMFTLVPILIASVFIIIIGKGIVEWNKNNQSPRITVPALVKTKRTSTSVHHHGSTDMHTSSSSSYYVTFQFDSGDRSEFSISGSAYGLLAEGDVGLLTFQGTRYLDFERKGEKE